MKYTNETYLSWRGVSSHVRTVCKNELFIYFMSIPLAERDRRGNKKIKKNLEKLAISLPKFSKCSKSGIMQAETRPHIVI